MRSYRDYRNISYEDKEIHISQFKKGKLMRLILGNAKFKVPIMFVRLVSPLSI